MISNTTVVELSEVKTRDDRLRITTKADIGSLAESIGQIGMINSPVLRQSGSGYRVVSGFRRIEACQLLQIKTIPAHLVDGSATDLFCVELAITDNAAQRDLNDLELSRCFMLLSPFYPAVASLVSAGRRLGLRAGAGYVRKLLCLASLPEEVQKAVGDGSISLSMSEALLKSNPRDTAALAALFILLRPSLNKQREIFLLCKELSKRDNWR